MKASMTGYTKGETNAMQADQASKRRPLTNVSERIKMFAVYFIFLYPALFLSCSQFGKESSGEVTETKADSTKLPVIEFISTEHDFGVINEGEKVGWYFKFRNTGKGNLLIINASASCGCTVPEYSREPIPPGGEGTIRVVFDASGREGSQVKQLTIETNAVPSFTLLTLKAEIKNNMSNQ
jgi:hypothetical protein